MCKTAQAIALLRKQQGNPIIDPSIVLRTVEALLVEALAESQPKTMSLSHERLLEVLHYDPQNGHFYWRLGHRRGLRAGWLKGDGYRIIEIDGVKCRASRLALFYVNKAWPEDEVDHINQIKDDDSIDNLRDVTSYVNGRNVDRPNPWGMPGVAQVASGKYRVSFKVDGKQRYFGLYDDQYDAVKVCKAQRKAHGVELG